MIGSDMNESALQISSVSEIIDDDNEYLFKVLSECNKWSDIEMATTQNRTNFQIEKFIIHDSYTIPSAFKMAINNRRGVVETLLEQIITCKKKTREFLYKWDGKDKSEPIWWGGGGKSTESLCWYDIDEFEYNRFMETQIYSIKSSVEEIEFFDRILEKLVHMNGGPLTREQFVEDQPKYWERRLSSQALDELLAAKTGINAGNIRSMRRASSPTVLDDDVNRTRGDFGDPKDMMNLLETLQKNVTEGIEEICGLSTGELLQSNQTNRIEQVKKPTKSLFNHDLIQ